MSMLAEPTMTADPLTHADPPVAPIASHPRPAAMAVHRVDPVLPAVIPVIPALPAVLPAVIPAVIPVLPGRATGDSEKLLGQRARLPAGHPDRARLRTRVIEANLPMAGRLARRYAGRGEPIDDLTQVAALALVKAVDRFDPDKGASFVAYAVPTILGDIRRHFRDTAWGMRVPRAAQELSRRVVIATSELSQRQGRLPVPTELADHLGVTTDELRAARGASQVYRLASLDAPHVAGPGTDLIGLVGGVDPRYAHVDDRLMLRLLLDSLPPREQRILILRFYGHLTQTEIAAEVGISQMHVSRLLKQTLFRLRTAMHVPPGQPPPGQPPRGQPVSGAAARQCRS